MGKKYVHGYSAKEQKRLSDQAATLNSLLHHDSIFPERSTILEAGCGVGSQTKIIAPKNPTCRFVSIDMSEASLEKARQRIESLKIKNVCFQAGNIFDMPFEDESFDHIFVCFVLEHLSDPLRALMCLKKVLKKGGTIMIIEGDHGSAFFHPHSEPAHKAIQCQVDLQRSAGGNALIGRELYPLLNKAGYHSVQVSPRMVYADSSRPEMVDGFTKKTFTAMIEGVKSSALEARIIKEPLFDQGIKDLYRTAEADGVFCYTFFKATAIKKERNRRT